MHGGLTLGDFLVLGGVFGLVLGLALGLGLDLGLDVLEHRRLCYVQGDNKIR